jgi:hypothetical protein
MRGDGPKAAQIRKVTLCRPPNKVFYNESREV